MKEPNLKDMIVYIDMDGVLADFDSKAILTPKYLKQKHGDNLHRVPGFYRDLKPLPGAVDAFKKLILTNNKGLLKGDILIDDNVWNGVEDFEGQHLHFGTDPNFMNWEDTLKYLLPNV